MSPVTYKAQLLKEKNEGQIHCLGGRNQLQVRASCWGQSKRFAMSWT